MIGKGKNNTAQFFLDRTQNPGQYPSYINEQLGIVRCMVRFDHSAVDSDLSPLFDIVILGITNQNPVDRFPCRIRKCLAPLFVTPIFEKIY